MGLWSWLPLGAGEGLRLCGKAVQLTHQADVHRPQQDVIGHWDGAGKEAAHERWLDPELHSGRVDAAELVDHPLKKCSAQGNRVHKL